MMVNFIRTLGILQENSINANYVSHFEYKFVIASLRLDMNIENKTSSERFITVCTSVSNRDQMQVQERCS